VAESGPVERELHAALMAEPRVRVAEKELMSLEDADMRENYRVLLRWRDRLLAAGTVEGAYMALFKGAVDVPPMFVDQLAHVILRNVLDGTDDALRLRAGELFFREQKATIKDGHVLLADLETVEMHASGHRYGSIGRLIVEAQGELGTANLDVLDRANAGLYWERESRHDTVVSFTYGRAALDAFARGGPGDPGSPDRRAALGLARGARRRVHRDPERAVGGQPGRRRPHAQHPGAVRAQVRGSRHDARRHRGPGRVSRAVCRGRGREDEAAEPAPQSSVE
jgi:hypothetical protein